MSDDPRQRRVDELPEYDFATTAQWAATQLAHGGNCYVELCPGDSTRYAIGILQWHNYHNNRGLMPGYQDRWFIANSFGPLYEWGGGSIVHWTYVLDHMVYGRNDTNVYTAMVLTRFLNTLSPLLKRKESDDES